MLIRLAVALPLLAGATVRAYVSTAVAVTREVLRTQ